MTDATMTNATVTTSSPLVEAMCEDDRRANTGPDDEDYTYYGPILRGAPMFTAADIASLQAIDERRDRELAAEQERISAIRAALLAGEERIGELEGQLAEAQRQGEQAQKLLMAYRVLLTGSLIVNAHAKRVDPDKHAHNYFAELMYLGLNGGAFAEEDVDGETLNIVCDHLHLPRFELEEEPRG